MLGHLAEAYFIAGKPERARERLDAALAHRASHGEHYHAPELYRLQALVLEQEGAPFESIEASLLEALDIARRQEAGLLELRAATSLAGYWSGRGKRDAARNLLAPLCGALSEGFDCPDFAEARAALQSLI
jgi:hypothetical protein